MVMIIHIYHFILIYTYLFLNLYIHIYVYMHIYNQNLTPYIIKIVIFISITIRNKMGNDSLYEHRAGVRHQGKPSGRW